MSYLHFLKKEEILLLRILYESLALSGCVSAIAIILTVPAPEVLHRVWFWAFTLKFTGDNFSLDHSGSTQIIL